MRRASISLVIALSTLLLVSICSAQQNTTKLVGGPDTVVNCTTAKNGYIPVFTVAPTPNITICNSVIYQANGNIGIGTTSPAATLDVAGGINTATTYEIVGSTVLSVGDPYNPYAGNLFLGFQAGGNTTGYANVFTGFLTGYYNTTGAGNVFTGNNAGFYNATGSFNVFTGASAGHLNTTGASNTFTGAGAGEVNTTGSDNVFTGSGAGYNNATGSYNVFTGSSGGYFNTNGNNNVYIANVGPLSGAESSTIRIGGDRNNGYGPQTAAYVAGIYGVNVGGIPVQINGNGQLGASTSSRRFKEQISDMGDSTSALMKLRPVTFLYKPEYANGDRTLQYGLIAEEVAKVYPELVAYDKDGRPFSVRYQYLTAMLLNEAQKQYRRAEAEAKVITKQEEKIDELEQRLSRLEKMAGSELQTVAQK
jgi:hypothetical protein